MKILFPIGAFYPSQIGGPCNTVYWHTCALNNNNIQVKIITTDKGIKGGDVLIGTEINNESGTVIYLANKKTPYRAFYKISCGIKWADIIHLNSLFNIFSIYSFLFTKLFYPRKTIFLSVRGELNPHALTFSSWKKKLILPFYQKFNKNIVFHGTSDIEIENIKAKFPFSESIYLPNYLSMTPSLKVVIKKQLLFMGRIHPIKAIHKLIQALSLSEVFLNKQYKMIIVGDAQQQLLVNYQKELKELVLKLKLSDFVEFKGHITGVEKETLYAESYALILPSETENFGNVVVEALNHGTPVIASLGTPWKILESYKCGIHVSNEPIVLAKSIDHILSLSKDEYLSWRKNANILVNENFNISSQIDNWINIYNFKIDVNEVQSKKIC